MFKAEASQNHRNAAYGHYLRTLCVGGFCPEDLVRFREFRKIALIIILVKAGLSLDLKDLKKVGRPAILLSFVPASFEMIAYVLFAPAVFMIFIALSIRAVGVFLCLIKTELSWKERIFVMISYLPKATVQAAIGSVPFAAGIAGGKNHSFRRRNLHFDHRPSWRVGNGFPIQEAS